MGLISSLCSELSISVEVLARIVGLPAEGVARWATGGVPPQHHSDFRSLEDLVELVRQRAPLPVRAAVRVGLPQLDGRGILEVLEAKGAEFVLERVRAAPALHPIWAGPTEGRSVA